MNKQIIIKPVISEKSERLSEEMNRYTFVVSKTANKLQIAKAVEEMFPGVTVEAVNTAVMPKKSKVRNTKSGIQRGAVASYKKAVVTIGEGEEIDFFGGEEEEA